MFNVVIALLPNFQILDLAGPAQVFDQAIESGAKYNVQYVAFNESIDSAQGLTVSKLQRPEQVTLNAGDLLIIPGVTPEYLSAERFGEIPTSFWKLLRTMHERGVRLCSVCTGSFMIAHAGLLNGKRCTTHWTCAEQLQQKYPNTRVVQDNLFIKEDGIYTSAGVASGIDLSLSIVEEDFGPLIAADVAKKLVVYMRRNDNYEQVSSYVNYRNHANIGIHHVQDWIVRHIDKKFSVMELAEVANMSARNLTRLFKIATGLTIGEFTNRIKFEKAKNLMSDPEITLDTISKACGYKNPRHFRRIWKKEFGKSLNESRSELKLTSNEKK